jgi:hypothetical protein
MKGAHLRNRRFSLSDYCLMAIAACFFVTGIWHMATHSDPGRVSSLTVKNTTTTTMIKSSVIVPETATTSTATPAKNPPLSQAPLQKTRVSPSTSVVEPQVTSTTSAITALSLEERVMAAARSEVGKPSPLAEDGFWCALWVSHIAAEAKVGGFQANDSPARLHTIAKEEGRLTGTAAYWFTSSTSFANPAVTVARTLSDSFAGISPSSVPWFLLAQAAGGAIGYLLSQLLYPTTRLAGTQALAEETTDSPSEPSRGHHDHSH